MDIKLIEKDRIKILNSEDLFAIMQKILLREDKIDQGKEHFWIVGLDADSRILFIELVVLGGVTSATVKPMEVFRVAVLKNAVSAILVHNHTASDVIPSDADKDLTDRLIQVGRILHVPVLDHLIITTRQYLSFEAEGLMEELRRSLKWVPPYEIELRIRNEELRIREEAVRAAREEGEREGEGIGMRRGLREGRKEGMEMGREEGRIEVVRLALVEGMEIGTVARISGLTEEEIARLKAEKENT
uniref:DNA repair protein RadC n=1 Tax=Candidatus Kentrum sp. SD TaxID=2126332 RepID=A0A450Z3W9_9GAMM|nr:MAG: DNA repair protein RadC [Candidatus Kentron sp. SD]VFK48481.1 MAG: DNA repair protein RadC [Candidatus Kentron sp. SD]